MASLSFSGKIVKIGVPTTGTGKNGEWTNTPIEVKEVDGEYPNSIVFSVLNKQEIIDTLTEGSIVEVLYNANTNEHNGKTYNSLNAWKIEVKDAAPSSVTTTAQTTKSKVVTTTAEDDLPF